MPRRVMAGLTGIALAGLLATTSFAYVGTISGVTVSAPSSVVSGKTFTLSALIEGDAPVEPAGAPVGGEEVGWDWEEVTAGRSGSAAVVTLGRVAAAPAVTLGALETTTDESGIARNTATVVCDGCTILFMATVDEVTGYMEVTVTGAALPNTATATSTGVAGAGGDSTGFLLLLLAAFALLSGAGLAARRVVVTRR